MTVQKQSEVVLGHVYICNACSTLRTILSNSILEDMKTSPLSLFVLLYCFYYQLDNTTFLKTETGIETNDSLCFYWKLLRNCLLETYVNYSSKRIGGNRNVVQINETVIVKRKYHREKVLSKENQWIIRGVDVVMREAFMCLVEKRDTAIIEAVLGAWVKSNIILHTYEWWVHRSAVENLNLKGHKMVCHKKWFVGPKTKVHTQSIEEFWSVFKRWLRKRSYNMGPASETLSYIGEFLWHRKEHTYEEFCDAVGKFFENQ